MHTNYEVCRSNCMVYGTWPFNATAAIYVACTVYLLPGVVMNEDAICDSRPAEPPKRKKDTAPGGLIYTTISSTPFTIGM